MIKAASKDATASSRESQAAGRQSRISYVTMSGRTRLEDMDSSPSLRDFPSVLPPAS